MTLILTLTIEYGNMSRSGRPRKIKQLSPGEQPQLFKFITDCPRDSTETKSADSKKRRRSTGEKPIAKKRADSSSTPRVTTSTLSSNEDSTQEEVVNKMSTIRMQDSNSGANSPMLDEIMKMEARLTASITTSRDKDISEMEARLNVNIRSTIDTSIKEAMQIMQTSICSAVQNNPQIKAHSTELKGLREENIRLNRKIQQLSTEQARMKRQLTKIESKNLDRSLIIKGIAEEYKENESTIIDKIHHTLSDIMQGETPNEKLLAVQHIAIKDCRRLGRYTRFRTRPISVEFVHKEGTNFILDNRFDLAKGVYVDREYPAETERKRKTLLPILKAAKRLPDYKRQSRPEDDKLVLKGRPYTVTMLNQLPDELNSFKVTSKENPSTVGFFGEINPLSNFFPASFTHEGVQYISSEQYIQASKASILR